MKKQLIAGMTSAALLAGLLPAALAAVPAETEAAQVLAALDIMVGDQSGRSAAGSLPSPGPNSPKWSSPPPPIGTAPARPPASPPIPMCPAPTGPHPMYRPPLPAGYVSGYLGGTFHPSADITLAEGVTMVLPSPGLHQRKSFTRAYPAGQMAAYHNLGLDEGISAAQNSAMTRRDALYLFYNLMTTKNKSGAYYLNTLEPTLNLVDTGGTLDRVGLINSAMDGPVVAEGNWQSRLPFSPPPPPMSPAGRRSPPPSPRSSLWMCSTGLSPWTGSGLTASGSTARWRRSPPPPPIPPASRSRAGNTHWRAVMRSMPSAIWASSAPATP